MVKLGEVKCDSAKSSFQKALVMQSALSGKAPSNIMVVNDVLKP